MYPKTLHIGDKVAIVSPSGRIDRDLIDATKQTLESWGLKVVSGKFAYNEYGRFAGTDEERFSDLQWALDNEDISAVICSRGGYGLIRLAGEISLKGFVQNPKWVVGFSDITVLHALLGQTGIASIHGPMCSHFFHEGEDESVNVLKTIFFGNLPAYHLPLHPLNKEGKSKGILRGGNLSLLSVLRGTPYDIIPENTILFLEDIGEQPYRIERMMYNLYLGGILEKLSGLIIGQFTDYNEDLSLGKSVYESIADMVSGYNYPVCFDFPTGHVKQNYPMICGAPVELTVGKNNVTCIFTKD